MVCETAFPGGKVKLRAFLIFLFCTAPIEHRCKQRNFISAGFIVAVQGGQSPYSSALFGPRASLPSPTIMTPRLNISRQNHHHLQPLTDENQYIAAWTSLSTIAHCFWINAGGIYMKFGTSCHTTRTLMLIVRLVLARTANGVM